MRRERHNDRIVGEVIARLRQLRRDQGLSQMDVYIDTDINIARIESGRGNISISTLADLCDYYQITLADFFRKEPPQATLKREMPAGNVVLQNAYAASEAGREAPPDDDRL